MQDLFHSRVKFSIFDGQKKLGGLTIEAGVVTEVDHEIRYMKGWIRASVDEYVKKCKWRLVCQTT
jgi:hypothetical protein